MAFKRSKGGALKKVFKIIGIISILLFSLIIFIAVSRDINKSKILKEILSYNDYSQKASLDKLNSENKSVKTKMISSGNIEGMHHIPGDILHKGAIIVLSDFERNMDKSIANYLSKNGYEVVVVYYGKQNDQSRKTIRVPIEIYEEIYSYINTNCENADTISIVAYSRGTELALLMSTYYESIDNAVLFGPSSYVLGSTFIFEDFLWTNLGKDIEYINADAKAKFQLPEMINVTLGKYWDNSMIMSSRIEDSTNLEEARIKVENSNAKVLMFYGEKDKFWNSKDMSNIIEKHSKNEIIIHGYENAGHGFTVSPTSYYMLNGGYSDSNIEADLDSKRIILETLELWHK